MLSYSILSCCSRLSRIHHPWCINSKTLDFALPCALSYIIKLHFPDWLFSRIEFVSCIPFLQVFGQEKDNYRGHIVHSKNLSNLCLSICSLFHEKTMAKTVDKKIYSNSFSKISSWILILIFQWNALQNFIIQHFVNKKQTKRVTSLKKELIWALNFN